MRAEESTVNDNYNIASFFLWAACLAILVAAAPLLIPYLVYRLAITLFDKVNDFLYDQVDKFKLEFDNFKLKFKFKNAYRKTLKLTKKLLKNQAMDKKDAIINAFYAEFGPKKNNKKTKATVSEDNLVILKMVRRGLAELKKKSLAVTSETVKFILLSRGGNQTDHYKEYVDFFQELKKGDSLDDAFVALLLQDQCNRGLSMDKKFAENFMALKKRGRGELIELMNVGDNYRISPKIFVPSVTKLFDELEKQEGYTKAQDRAIFSVFLMCLISIPEKEDPFEDAGSRMLSEISLAFHVLNITDISRNFTYASPSVLNKLPMKDIYSRAMKLFNEGVLSRIILEILSEHKNDFLLPKNVSIVNQNDNLLKQNWGKNEKEALLTRQADWIDRITKKLSEITDEDSRKEEIKNILEEISQMYVSDIELSGKVGAPSVADKINFNQFKKELVEKIISNCSLPPDFMNEIFELKMEVKEAVNAKGWLEKKSGEVIAAEIEKRAKKREEEEDKLSSATAKRESLLKKTKAGDPEYQIYGALRSKIEEWIKKVGGSAGPALRIEIRREFRKLAVLCHPDKIAGEKPEETFKIVNEVFDEIREENESSGDQKPQPKPSKALKQELERALQTLEKITKISKECSVVFSISEEITRLKKSIEIINEEILRLRNGYETTEIKKEIGKIKELVGEMDGKIKVKQEQLGCVLSKRVDFFCRDLPRENEIKPEIEAEVVEKDRRKRKGWKGKSSKTCNCNIQSALAKLERMLTLSDEELKTAFISLLPGFELMSAMKKQKELMRIEKEIIETVEKQRDKGDLLAKALTTIMRIKGQKRSLKTIGKMFDSKNKNIQQTVECVLKKIAKVPSKDAELIFMGTMRYLSKKSPQKFSAMRERIVRDCFFEQGDGFGCLIKALSVADTLANIKISDACSDKIQTAIGLANYIFMRQEKNPIGSFFFSKKHHKSKTMKLEAARAALTQCFLSSNGNNDIKAVGKYAKTLQEGRLRKIVRPVPSA